MGKYLVLWEVVQTQIPVDPKERGEGWGMLMAKVRQDIEKGITVVGKLRTRAGSANGSAFYLDISRDYRKILKSTI